MEPVQSDLEEVVSGDDDEVGLCEALKSPRIKNGSIENLKQALRYAMVKVGLRANNWPADEEKAILLRHIISGYGNHTAEEIKLAFDMAITGKIDIERKEVVCYENFSCLYFSGIMDSYRRWANQAYRHAVKEAPPPTRKYSKLELDMDYMEFLWRNKKREYKQRLKLPLK